MDEIKEQKPGTTVVLQLNQGTSRQSRCHRLPGPFLGTFLGKQKGTKELEPYAIKNFLWHSLQFRNTTAFILFIYSCTIFIACAGSKQHVRVVLLPDTQTYAEKYPQVLDSQISWIASNAKDINFVLQQGDLTQNNNDKEWAVVQKAFSTLNNKVPYVLAAGNHDMGSADGLAADNRNTEKFNKYFPEALMRGLPGYGATAEAGKMENAYYRLKAGNKNWLIITLEFGPRNMILDWASKVISQHPDDVVIINTHAYMYSDSTRMGNADRWRPQVYGVGKDTADQAVNDGEQMWQKFVKVHPSVRFVFSGHVLNNGEGSLVSINDAGYPVYQMLANYQEGVKGSVMGGNGWLRIIDMDLKKKTLQVSTYSPFIREFNTSPAHRFLIRNMYFGNGR